ncbi:MAG: hypothetical protein IKY86_00625 [Clostridia bacterium]|nr:hypothetical protein [Clostridia bacterium]
MLIFQIWEVGVFEGLVRPNILPLFAGAWIGLLLGAGIQLSLLKNCRGFGRWGLGAVMIVLLLMAEGFLHLAKHWQGFWLVVFARYAVYPLLGAALTWVLWRLKKRS